MSLRSILTQVTDVGISALGSGCGELQTVNLEGCAKVTDAGVSALAAGCGQLRSIDLGDCVAPVFTSMRKSFNMKKFKCKYD